MLDIQQSRRVLVGPDLLADMRIEPLHLRLAVERELTGKLLSLRGKFAVVADRPRPVQDLMLGSLSTFLVLFRAALRLYQESVPDIKLDALHALAQAYPFDTAPFERLFEAKQLSPSGRRVPWPMWHFRRISGPSSRWSKQSTFSTIPKGANHEHWHSNTRPGTRGRRHRRIQMADLARHCRVWSACGLCR